MAPKVLISDSLSQAAVQIFKDRGIDVDFMPALGKDKDAFLVAIPKYKAPTKRSRESDGEEGDDWMMEDDVDDDDESDCDSDDGDDDGGNTNCPLGKPNSILIICGLLQFIIPKENL